MAILFSSQLAVPADVEIVGRVGDESVLLDLKSERYVGLDSVSTRVWQVLTGGGTVQAATTLCWLSTMSNPAARADLEDFVQS